MLDPELMSAALPGEPACGANLDAEPAWLELELAAAGEPESQYGDHIKPATPPDWLTVHERALALASRTRDLRLAVWLARSGARLQGLAGFTAGLQLVQQLVLKHWDTVHPQLDATDNNDATYRLNTLAQLAAAEAGLADLRAAALAPVRGSMTVRTIELTQRGTTPYPQEAVPTAEGVEKGLRQLMVDHPALQAQAAQAAWAARQLLEETARRVSAERLPNLAALVQILELVDRSMAAAAGPKGGVSGTGVDTAATTTATTTGTTTATGLDAHPQAPRGAIASRADAVQQLSLVCDWIERHEPSHPAPLLIRRAQRLMDKNFIDIIRDLSPESLGQVQLIAGTEAPQP